MTLPVPDDALDDRLGFLGMTGSGKTFGAGTCVERILARGGRVVIPDALGVWFGLRLAADGKTSSKFDLAIFGGPHADIPITPNAGALIGETAAAMRESAIVDLSQFETAAAERRFMLAFLNAFYRKATGAPVHLIFDEADLWAPERIVDREGNATQLHGMMQNVVRRGRVKGLTSWLISQRPAALSKSVLSQVDGLAAFKLTAAQDRKALGSWIEGQADREEGKAILGRLPTKQLGEAVVWLPARGILSDVKFPAKRTYDSSRTPRHGEKRSHVTLPPLDLSALREKLATVEEEAKANDPAKLRAELATVQRQLAEALASKSKPDHTAIEEAEKRGYERAEASRNKAAARMAAEHVVTALTGMAEAYAGVSAALAKAQSLSQTLLREAKAFEPAIKADAYTPAAPTPRPDPRLSSERKQAPAGDGSLSKTDQRMLGAIAYWNQIGIMAPTRVQVAFLCGWRPTSGHPGNIAGSLRSRGLIDYPTEGTIALTEEGARVAPEPDMAATVADSVRAVLNGTQRKAFDALYCATPDRELSREDLAIACGWSIRSGHPGNVFGSMRSLEVVTYPAEGRIALASWITSTL